MAPPSRLPGTPCMDLVFILVEPARAANVGAAARALKTMGFTGLWLVNPCELAPEAWWVAHESGELLDQARHFPDLASALAEVDFSIATGARRRLDKDDYLLPQECRSAIAGKAASIGRAALVFGRESSGLTGEEVALCDAASRIPMAVEQPSLNLAQAVMLYAWELSQGKTEERAPPSPTGATLRVVRERLDNTLSALQVGPDDNLRQWAHEALAHCNDRDLGLLMTLLRRLPDTH